MEVICGNAHKCSRMIKCINNNGGSRRLCSHCTPHNGYFNVAQESATFSCRKHNGKKHWSCVPVGSKRGKKVMAKLVDGGVK